MNHDSIPAIAISAYYVPRLELDLTISSGLDGRHEATGQGVSVGRNLFSQDDAERPTGANLIVVRRCISISGDSWDLQPRIGARIYTCLTR